MTGIVPQSPIVPSNPIAELAASMAAFKVDTEMRREGAAEAREGAFKGADTQEKNTAVELLKENKALADLYAQAQRELEGAKSENATLKRNYVVLKNELHQEKEKNCRLQEGIKSLVKSLEEKHSEEPILFDCRIYAGFFTPTTFNGVVERAKEQYELENELFKTYQGLEKLEDTF